MNEISEAARLIKDTILAPDIFEILAFGLADRLIDLIHSQWAQW